MAARSKIPLDSQIIRLPTLPVVLGAAYRQ